MTSEQSSQESFNVVGLKIRTTNSKELSGKGQIQALWEKFYTEQIASKISDKMEDHIFAVYHDYESDANGEYALIIGLKVKPGTTVPEGLNLVHIPQQNYMKLTTNKGPMPAIVIDGWKHIWDKTIKSELKRKYSADFEVYDQRCADPSSAQMDIYIAIK